MELIGKIFIRRLPNATAHRRMYKTELKGRCLGIFLREVEQMQIHLGAKQASGLRAERAKVLKSLELEQKAMFNNQQLLLSLQVRKEGNIN